MTEDNQFVRLYPVDYRYRPLDQRFRKYQWIEVALGPRGSGNDNRKESRKPDLESLVLGERLEANGNWRERRRIIDSLDHHTMDQLEVLYTEQGTSLGIVRPTEVLDVVIEPADREWKREWQLALKQFDLFGGKPKELEKLPFKWSYVFRCEDNPEPYKRMIEDWELGVLFLKERDRLGGEEAAAQSVRRKYLEELCAPTRDTRFFVGTRFPYNTWLVLGVFWPPVVTQGELMI